MSIVLVLILELLLMQSAGMDVKLSNVSFIFWRGNNEVIDQMSQLSFKDLLRDPSVV